MVKNILHYISPCPLRVLFHKGPSLTDGYLILIQVLYHQKLCQYILRLYYMDLSLSILPRSLIILIRHFHHPNQVPLLSHDKYPNPHLSYQKYPPSPINPMNQGRLELTFSSN
jgi:hypothetical protein